MDLQLCMYLFGVFLILVTFIHCFRKIDANLAKSIIKIQNSYCVIISSIRRVFRRVCLFLCRFSIQFCFLCIRTLYMCEKL